ncbi:glucose-1-phosphate adenylyltransferase subunit GlgD [Lactococcus termiticola]|uniref:Glucose-1-phosphate adenylyltransferase n=1 Tax=Lactococcus termiticola TaxID=2169526 RepID=A0A2R5HJI8_9LACT|nr:glucose-1-phosphate adenylyltransferase subunit GlgD [Lactococcus termiticola]GBG96770.1 glucose-1-phosphate adenylyltransferase [Lactococcus termiticola]
MNNSNKMCALLSNVTTYDNLKPLTDNRPISTLPFDCKYRMIDFPLSSLANANVKDILLTFNEGETQSVYDHIGSGKEWGLSSLGSHFFVYIMQDFLRKKEQGLPFYETQLEFLKKSRAPYTVLIGSKILANVDLQAVLKVHQASGNKVTAVYKKASSDSLNPYDSVLRFDEETGKPLAILHKDLEDPQPTGNLLLNTFICDTDFLSDFIRERHANGDEEFASVNRHIRNHLSKLDGVGVYEYTGYASNIIDIKTYFEANLEMLEPKNFTSLLYGAKPIYTKIKNEVPTFFAETSDVNGSQFGSGCVVKGKVTGSLISRGVNLEENTDIERSLIFAGSTVKAGAQIKNAILDKNVVIEPGVKIIGKPDSEPLVIAKGSRITEDIIAG